MELAPEGIDEFRKIFKKEYGKEFTNEEAKEAGSNLLNFLKLLMEIDQQKKHKGKKEDNNEK